MAIPKSFSNLVDNLSILPGVGEKTAERYVYSLYERDNKEKQSSFTGCFSECRYS